MTARKTRRTAFEALENRQLLSASLTDLVAKPNVTLTPSATVNTPQGYSPTQIKKAYGFDSISLNGVVGDGTGQTIAIVDAYNDPNIASDLSTFSSTFGLPQANLTVVSQTGSKTALPKTDAGWATEIALDVEWAHAIAPGAKILLVEAKSDSLADLLTAVDYARNAAGVSVVSMSWGTSEFMSQTSYDSHFTTPPGHTGVTFVAASGDEGSWYGPEWPSTSPNVLSVGGTTLNLDSSGNVSSETPWSDSTGGVSGVESAKTYQSNVTGSTRRTNPDVSYDADPNTGFAVYDTVPYQGYSGWATVGGTSAGAPQWAALVAIANQGRSLNGQAPLDGATGTLPALYSLYAAPGSASYATYTSYFTDITDTQTVLVRTGGTTRWGWYGRRGGGWTTQTVTTGQGYDTVTGLGTPEAAQVVSALVGANTASATTAKAATRMTSAYRHARWTAALVEKADQPAVTPAAIQPMTGMPQVEAIEHANVANVAGALPKITFVLSPVRALDGDAMASTNVATPSNPFATSATPVATNPARAMTEAVGALAGSRAEITAAVQTAGTAAVRGLASAVATGVETAVAHAGAVFASAMAAGVAGVTDDGWEMPAAAAGAVLMFSWAMERIAARRRAAAAEVAAADIFNLVRKIGEPLN